MAWTGRVLHMLTSRAPLAQANLLSGVDDHLGVKVRRSASPSFTIEEPAPQAGAFDSPLGGAQRAHLPGSTSLSYWCFQLGRDLGRFNPHPLFTEVETNPGRARAD